MRTVHQPYQTQNHKQPCQTIKILDEKSWRWHFYYQKSVSGMRIHTHTQKKKSYISLVPAGWMLPYTLLVLLKAFKPVLSILMQLTVAEGLVEERKSLVIEALWNLFFPLIIYIPQLLFATPH